MYVIPGTRIVRGSSSLFAYDRPWPIRINHSVDSAAEHSGRRKLGVDGGREGGPEHIVDVQSQGQSSSANRVETRKRIQHNSGPEEKR